MIAPNDKIMVCLSGGKDSYCMLDLLLHFQKTSPIKFEIVAVNLDQKQPGFPQDILPNYLKSLGIDFKIVEKDTYSIVKEKIPEGKTMCSLCSRLRRGILYSTANELGATKIALGHHRNDIIETLFLNMFFSGRLKAMAPKLRSNDGKNIVIRPLSYCYEDDLTEYAKIKKFPIIPCNLCGSQENLQRKVIKDILKNWEKNYPGRLDNIFNSLQRVSASHLLDRELYNFDLLKRNTEDLEVTDGIDFINILDSKDKILNKELVYD
ncbi:MAG: tRNA 2-thiocytidine biosynthesis protein TtcA [Candidatus Sericytochromatia bacterium]|nr:MAG: tRNA 2-thiocytidine biosynthesis protein TtcA [Candidatus Sericytochromatia bacterium]